MKKGPYHHCICFSIGLLLSLTFTVNAQFRVLHNFVGGANDGANPNGDLIQSGPALYGMTSSGGSSGNGVIFEISTDGTVFQMLHTFTGATSDGAQPLGSLLQSGSMLYGLTYGGGISGNGTVFQINTNGSGFQVIHQFTVSDGIWPWGSSLIQYGSTLYGTATAGGSAPDWNGNGTVFCISTNNNLFQVLHTFTGTPSDGSQPYASLIQSKATLCGITTSGGSSDNGIIFQINVDGTAYHILHQFTGSSNDGSQPYMNKLILSGSAFYGATYAGGSNNLGTIFRINVDGTGFQLLHSFIGSDGQHPEGGLTQFGSKLYGMTSYGSIGGNGDTYSGNGVIYQIDTNGTGFQLLHSFSGSSDGRNPFGCLVLSDSTLYGMTEKGGSNNFGVIFALDLRLLTGVHEEKSPVTIKDFSLEQNYPNPFNPTTIIGYKLPVAGNVKISIYNLLGQKIKTLANSFQSVGEHSAIWDATDENNNPVSSGMYFYRLEKGDQSLQKKMLLIR